MAEPLLTTRATRDPNVLRKRIAIVIAALITVFAVLIIVDTRRQGEETERAVTADACSKGREASLACRAQTCRRLRAVVRERSLAEVRELLNCERIEQAAREGATELPGRTPVVKRETGGVDGSGGGSNPSPGQPSPGESPGGGGNNPGGGGGPGPQGPPGPPGSPGSPGGGSSVGDTINDIGQGVGGAVEGIGQGVGNAVGNLLCQLNPNATNC